MNQEELKIAIDKVLTDKLIDRVRIPADLARQTGIHGLEIRHNERYRQARQFVWDEISKTNNLNDMLPADLAAFNDYIEVTLKKEYFYK